MKKIIMVGAVVAAVFTTSAFAGAAQELKGTNLQDSTNSNGGIIGKLSSSFTGNGATISNDVQGPSRSAYVHSLQDAPSSYGVDNTPGNSENAPGHK